MMSENALLASGPNNVFLVNTDTIQVAITLQGNASHFLSNLDGDEALVELKSQSDSNK